MDAEQRIGRIHRYGQAHTAQVYNLVLLDTIEGRIFLLLDDKLTEIARTLGKKDDRGNVAEDLRSQILGQLSERLNYERLYQEALSDPELKRPAVELDAALSHAREAREVVFDLFQDREGFSLDDYKAISGRLIGNGSGGFRGKLMVMYGAEAATMLFYTPTVYDWRRVRSEFVRDVPGRRQTIARLPLSPLDQD